MKIALVLGHNERSQGAYSKYIQNTEYRYYKEVAKEVKEVLGDRVDIFIRKSNKTYGAEMREVLARLKSSKTPYKFILELHFNSVTDPRVQGVECLAYYKSKKGLELANKFNKLVSSNMGIKDRGIIKIENSKQRGGYGICNTKPPYVLIEPFFGSNEKAKEFTVKKMAELIISFIEGESDAE